MMQYTIHLPESLAMAVDQRAARQHMTPEAWVAHLVEQHLRAVPRADIHAAFEREAAAFDRLQPALMAQYAGEYVAVYQEQVAAHGVNAFSVLKQVQAAWGDVVCYVGLVSAESPRLVRLPSAHIVRS